MRKSLKIAIGVLLGVAASAIGLIGFGLWTMDIEDRYGDLQDIYYQSEDGDLIVLRNKYNAVQKYGLLEKSGNRIYVQDNHSSARQELDRWVNAAHPNRKWSVYRDDRKRGKRLLFQKPGNLDKLIWGKELELILTEN